jgi:hypothetical protein
VTIDETNFLVNGQLTYSYLAPTARGRLMNARMVNAIFDDENPETRPAGFDPDRNTEAFISSMDEYRSKGILAFTVNLQGGMPGYEGAVNSAFRPDGSLKDDYLARAAKVIEAADTRGAVIILGLFYQRQDQILSDEDAVKAAAQNVARWLRDCGYSNVLVEIANEYRHPGFDHDILLQESGQVELMKLFRSVHPAVYVSTSGMGDAEFPSELAEAADFILIHGNTTDPEEYHGKIGKLQGYRKPIVFNEDWCFSDDTRGVFDAVEKMKRAFLNGASWGVMNQQRNQTWPFRFGIGRPDEGPNAQEDYELYEALAELLGLGEGPTEEPKD